MIRAVWPGNLTAARGAVRADWLAMPVRDTSIDIVVGDGSPIALRYPEELRRGARNIRAAMKPGGLLALRAFVRPAAKEDPRDVIASLPRHATLSQFKLRLFMALQSNPEAGCRLDDLYRYWAACHIDRDALARATGWERAEIDTIDRYRKCRDVYTFPTLAELRSVLAEFFSHSTASIPTYPLGERCPTLVLRP
jgi:SAM-dependent methyltransferase